MKTKVALTCRQITLETLRSSGALFRWHPLLVDMALDQPGGYGAFNALLSDPVFAYEVRQIVPQAPSLAGALGGEPIERLRDPASFLAKPFLAGMRRKVLARMKLTVHSNQLLSEEIDERLRFEYLRMANRFVPGITEADGSECTFGFKAFLENQLPYKVRDIVRRCIADFGRNDYPEDMDERLWARSASIGESDTANAIRQALRLAMRSTRDAELLGAFLRENGALAAFAAREQCSAGKIRRELEALFVRAAAHLRTEGKAVGSPRLMPCRQALQDMAAAEGEERYISARRRFYFGIE